jgi:hypothetical protein
MAGQIDQIVSVAIQASAASPQVPNFGTPAVVAYHTHYLDRIRTYTSLAGMVADGFTITEAAYLLARAIFAQTPSPSSVKVIRATTAVAQVIQFTVTDTTNGDVVGITLLRPDGTVATIQHTVASETATQVATALAALSITGATLGSSGAVVTITISTAGQTWYLQSIAGGTIVDNTPSASLATDLNAAVAVDSDFYGFSTQYVDATNIAAASSWAESNKRIHYYTTSDSNNTTAGTGIGNTLKSASDAYSFGVFKKQVSDFAAAAAMGNEFVRDPGTYTMAFKQLAGVQVDKLTDTEIQNLETNNLNHYDAVAGVNITRQGVCASGLYVDLRRGIDALSAAVQFNVYDLLVTSPKVPYDPFGIAMVGAEVRSALAQFTSPAQNPTAALLRGDPGFAPIVTLPAISTVQPIDRQQRRLKGVGFVAYAQNAVQTVQIQGVVNI